MQILTKAPQYAARAGQQIAGNLYRGADGKFTAGSSTTQPKTPTTRQQRRAKKPAATSAEKRAANIDRVRSYMRDTDAGLNQNAFDALMSFNSGEKLNDSYRQGLIDGGILEQFDDGSVALTATGRRLVNAIERGNERDAVDAYNKASQNKRSQTKRNEERETKRQQREAAKQERQRQAEARKQEREKTPR